MKLLLLQFFLALFWNGHSATIPLVVNTWKFENATRNAWSVLKSNEPYEQKVYDALIVGCGTCQKEQCDFTVGYGGSPDENGETTLDALIFDGDTINMGAVGGLRRIKNAIAVAKLVLDNTEHSVLVGDLSTEFAKKLGFNEETLSTNHSINVWKTWEKQNCQPNFWKNVSPNPKTQCGPYKPIKHISRTNIIVKEFSSNNHDTIGMIVIDENGHVVAGTSTNGANHKIPGRIGDSPIPGAGAYADSDVGAATATGDGDVMMRFLPSFLAVEQMRNGMSPAKAAKVAILRIAVKYPTFFGGIVAVNKKGEIGAACNGMDKFPFTLANYENDEPITKYVECTNYNSNK